MFVNAAQENGERSERKRVMLSIQVARMGVDGWVKGKCRFQSDEEAHAMLQFYGAGLLRFSQAINKKCHINSSPLDSVLLIQSGCLFH